MPAFLIFLGQNLWIPQQKFKCREFEYCLHLWNDNFHWKWYSFSRKESIYYFGTEECKLIELRRLLKLIAIETHTKFISGSQGQRRILLHCICNFGYYFCLVNGVKKWTQKKWGKEKVFFLYLLVCFKL